MQTSPAVGSARDGTRLAYTLYGRDDLPTRAVLVHSLGLDRSFWEPVAERLAEHAAVLVYDCRGHGASGKPPGPYSVAQFAADLADLLDQCGWQRALIGGASMGGCVAMAFAAAYPDRTAALGLFDTTAWYGPEGEAQWAERAQHAVKSGLTSLVEFQTGRWFTELFRRQHPDIVAQCVETFLRNDAAAYAAACQMLGACDLRSALPRLDVPTAILVGEEDAATPVEMAEALQHGIAGATLSVIHAARHLLPLEQPDLVAATLRRLLSQTMAA